MLSRSFELRMVGPAALLTIALAACSSGSVATAPVPTAPPTTAAPTTAPTQAAAVPTPSASSSVEPSPTLPVLPNGGKFGPGGYATLFEPRVTLTLEGYGDSNVDSSSWIDLAYEGDPSLEVDLYRLDQVFDPKRPPTQAPEICDICYRGGKLLDPPKDFASWLARLPGLTVLSAAKRVRVGGLDASQLDVHGCTRNVLFGPLAGLGQPIPAGLGVCKRSRLISLAVNGHLVLMTIGGGTSGVEASDASMEKAQRLIDSIVWH